MGQLVSWSFTFSTPLARGEKLEIFFCNPHDSKVDSSSEFLFFMIHNEKSRAIDCLYEGKSGRKGAKHNWAISWDGHNQWTCMVFMGWDHLYEKLLEISIKSWWIYLFTLFKSFQLIYVDVHWVVCVCIMSKQLLGLATLCLSIKGCAS